MKQIRFSDRSSRPQLAAAAEASQKENLEKHKSKPLIHSTSLKAKKEKGEEDAKGRIQVLKQTSQRKPIPYTFPVKVLKNVDQNKSRKEMEEQKILKQLQSKAEKLEMKLDDLCGQSASSYQKMGLHVILDRQQQYQRKLLITEMKAQSEQLKARISQLQKASRPEEHPFEEALGALSGNVEFLEPQYLKSISEQLVPDLQYSTLESEEYRASHRKISNELDFDSHLCDRVDMLLNQNDHGHRMGRNENLPLETQQQQEQSFRLDEFEESKAESQPVQMKKKPSKKFKKPEADLLKLRSRTETPSKAKNVAQELVVELVVQADFVPVEDNALAYVDHQEQLERDWPFTLQGKNIAGLTRQNLLQLDAMNNKALKGEVPSKSPSKLLQKHLARQQKAEMLRAQIVQNRREQLEKIRTRWQDTKRREETRHDRMQQAKRTKLHDKIEHARENRNIELTNIKQRAQMDLQSVEDIKYIMRMTTNNLQLDINNKLNETEERRNQLLQEQMRKLEDQKLKEEEVQKRRTALLNFKLEVIKKAEIKRKEAQQRKLQLLNDRKKVVADQRREKVLQRKNFIGEKMNDMMSLVNDKDNIWELIGNEASFKDENQKHLIKRDLLSLEKSQLKQDAQFLNKIIQFNEDGKMQVKFEQNDYQHFLKMLRSNEFLENSSENTSEDESDERKSNISSNKVQYQFLKNREEKELEYQTANDLSLSGYNQAIESSPAKEKIQDDKNSEAIASYGSMKDEQEDPAEDINGHFNEQIVLEEAGINSSTMSIDKQIHLKLTTSTSTQSLQGALRRQGSNLQPATNILDQSCCSLNAFQAQSAPATNNCAQPLPFFPFITDEEELLMLIESRIHWSIKRNVLRDTISEDLEYAQCVKNDHDDFFDKLRYNTAHQLNIQETRSLQSTPERRKKMGETANQREKSCDDRIFGSASSRRRFKKSSRINSRRSSISSNMYRGLQKSKSKDILVANSSNILLESRSLQMLNKEAQGSALSKNKRLARDSSRDSYDSHRIIGRSSLGSIQPRNLFQNAASQSGTNTLYQTEETKDDTSIAMTSQSHTTNFGSQMNQLITSMKPIITYPSSKILPKLSTNAMKILFPIREQRILFKRPGKAGQFASARVTIKLEDVSSIHAAASTQIIAPSTPKEPPIVQTQQQPAAVATESASQSTPVNLSVAPSLTPTLPLSSIGDSITSEPLLKQQLPDKSNESTPKKPIIPAKSTPLQNSAKNSHNTSRQEKAQKTEKPDKVEKSDKERKEDQVFKEHAIKYLLSGQHNDLMKNEESQKSIELNDEDPENIKNIEQFLDRLESSELQFRYCRSCECILNNHTSHEWSYSEQPVGAQASPLIQEEILQEAEETNLEAEYELIRDHVQSKQHRKIRDDLGIKEIEDMCFSIFNFSSSPGDISKELIKEKEKALKRKVKRLKVQLQQMTITHENASCQQPWKDYSSLNKKTLQIRCLELEKQVNPAIRDYDALDQNLKEVIKLLQVKNQGDLMLFRKLKFIPTLVDICKRILICPKQEFKHLGKVIEQSIKIISIFCTLRENRNYMFQTNRLLPLIDLLNWCMNRPTAIFFGISFLPQLFQIITLHIKHRTPFECIQSKEYLIEMLVCSQLMMKIKNKFAIINYPMAMDMSQMNGQVPMFLLKSITFLEALTQKISSDARYRPVYERNHKLAEHYLFVMQKTEIFGIIQMIATLLLTHSEQFKTSCNSTQLDQNTTKIMPQTFLSLAIVSIKVLNNTIRMDVQFVQELLVNSEMLEDQLFHLLNYLLVYTHENYDKNEDTKELLHETLMFIGYYCLLNEKTQQILHRGENTALQKMCNLPFPYFSDKKLKEILFPTLIMASYKSERCVAIMNQEISFDPLIKFLQDNMKEELPRIMEEEFDYQSISSFGEPVQGKPRNGGQGHRGRSPSISSANSSGCSIQLESIGDGNCPYLPLFMRFPKTQWQDAIDFYQKLSE